MKKFVGILVSILCFGLISFHMNVTAASEAVKEQEPNDTAETANSLAANTVVNGSIGDEESDVYKFTLKGADTLEFKFTQEQPLSSLALFNSEKDFVGYIYNAASNESNLKYSELPEGLYYLQVFDNSTKATPDYDYELQVIMKQNNDGEASGNQVTSFPDVKADHSAFAAVEWAKKQGIASGYENGSFGPDDPVTEAQFAGMLKNFYDTKAVDMQLTKTSENWADEIYNSLAAYGVPLKGYFDDALRNQPMQRGLAALALVHFSHNSLDLGKLIQFLLDEKISTGLNEDQKNDVLEYFGYKNELTRAQAVTFLYRMNLEELNKIGESAQHTYENEKGYSLDELAKEAETKIHEDLRGVTKNEAKSIVNDLMAGIIGTFERLGDQHNWSFENKPDFSILRPELEKYASEEFTDGFLKEVKDEFYCSCDVPPYPSADLDIRFTLHESSNNRFVASSIEFDNMISSGSTVYYTVIKENGKWVLDDYHWVSLKKEPISLTWEEVKAHQEKEGSKVELLTTATYEGEKIYIFKYVDTNKIVGMYADNSGYMLEVPSSLLP